ncbi:zinc-binding alcohol dehydrogenase family protein [Haliangium ochraceum]|uniref:Zinc-type alcohol dehydrogenase-like protein n=1 Tax=Haliangium ochraceum (strain DSM 14365 / JCM 11303 / SMP-2) TaxID=502025 RepID=D0LL56_HALO1|nr:zinc-binding alcohol dehydrogenase family protein [Haliangium ochraceum]ACY18552.1 zinc-binding alcohol dehydrogenase family protein [Haliangium ochraceum DSM 14365]
MKAWIVSSDDTDRFAEVELPDPSASGRDLLVRVEALSLNPVDTKVRKGRAGKILGWDASGRVVALGDQVTGFQVGDEVYYAGDITRPGCNAQLQVVDERLVAHKPKRLSHVQAAAIPLTALTAWEGLYEQLAVREGASLLVINSAGGVGSLVVQMAKNLSKMHVIGTASRPESAAWARQHGADDIINHRQDMPEQLRALGREHVDYVFCCAATAAHFPAMAEMIAPQGRIVSIVETDDALPLGTIFSKKASFSWEFMFAKSMHGTSDMDSQGQILARVAELLEAGTLQGTLTEAETTLTAEALAEAHAAQAAGRMIGKRCFRVPQPSE